MLQDAVIIEEFKRLTLEILRHDGPRGILIGLVGELVDILEKTAEFQIDEEAGITEGETASNKGLAISPAQAAMCAGEEQRTAVFLLGLHDAIADKVKTKSSGLVRVLYAGSGPYATLATPLMSVFPPEKVQFTILDIHPESMESAKAVIRRLGLENCVESFVVADACEYTIPRMACPDIILSETMSTALEKEPQVAIMRHLLSQSPDAAIVPASVQVKLFLVDTSQEINVVVPESVAKPTASHPAKILAGEVFELNASNIRSWASLPGDQLPAARIALPSAPSPDYRPFLFTTITSYGDHTLRTHDSGLTGLREVTGSGDRLDGATLQFHYRLGANPQLVAEMIP